MPVDIKQYNPVFKKTYEFMAKHLNASTDEDFIAIIDDLAQFTESFESEMAVAIVGEIEKRYKEAYGE